MKDREKKKENPLNRNVHVDECEYSQKRARIEMDKQDEQKLIRRMLKKL
jgi:hypothetical protein